MHRRRIFYHRAAQADLRRIRGWIAFRVSTAFGKTYQDRIRSRIATLDLGSERGTVRDDIRSGVCVIGIMRSISVAFSVTDERVVILRVFYGGQDWRSAIPVDLDDD